MVDLKKYKLDELKKIPPLKLLEKLPQVGTSKIPFCFNSDKNTFSINESFIEPIDYIINSNYELLLGIGHYKLNKKKEELVSAGRMIIDKKIIYIDNDSGHYPPSIKHTIEISKYLISIGLAIPNIEVVNIKTRL